MAPRASRKLSSSRSGSRSGRPIPTSTTLPGSRRVPLGRELRPGRPGAVPPAARHGHERSDPGRPLPDDRALPKGEAGRLVQPVTRNELVRRPGQLPERPPVELVELGDEDGSRRREVPVERRRALHQGLPIGDMAGHELLQADRLEAAVGLGDGPGLDEPEGGDGGRVVERLELVVAQVRRPPDGDDRPVAIRADEDRLDDGVAAVGQPDGRQLAARVRLDRRRPRPRR